MQPSLEPRQPNRNAPPRFDAAKSANKAEKKSEIVRSQSTLEKTRASLQKKLASFEDAFTAAALKNGKDDIDVMVFAAGLDNNYKPSFFDRITGKLEMIDAALEWKRVKTALANLAESDEKTVVLAQEAAPVAQPEEIEDMTEHAELLTPAKELGFESPMEELEQPVQAALKTLKEAYPKGYNFEDAALKLHIESETMSEFDLHELSQLLRAEFAKKDESYLYGGLNKEQRAAVQANLSQFDRAEKQLNRDRAQLSPEDSQELVKSLEQRLNDTYDNAQELSSQIERHVNANEGTDYPTEMLAQEYGEMLDLLNHDLSEAQFFLDRLPSSADAVARQEMKAKLEATKGKQIKAWTAHRSSRFINTGRTYAGAKSVAFSGDRTGADLEVGKMFPTPTRRGRVSPENVTSRTKREMTDVELLSSLNIPNKINYLRKEMEVASDEKAPDLDYFRKRLNILQGDLEQINAGQSMDVSPAYQQAKQDVAWLNDYYNNILAVRTNEGFEAALAKKEANEKNAEKNRAEILGEYMETVMDFQSEFLNRFPGEDLRQVIADKANREIMFQEHELTDEERGYFENKFNLINWKAKLLNISFPPAEKRNKIERTSAALPSKHTKGVEMSVDSQLSPRHLRSEAMNAQVEAAERDFLGDSYEAVKQSEEKDNDAWRIRAAIDRAAKAQKIDGEAIKSQYMDALMEYRDLQEGKVKEDLDTEYELRTKLVELNKQLGWPAGLNLDFTRGDVDQLGEPVEYLTDDAVLIEDEPVAEEPEEEIPTEPLTPAEVMSSSIVNNVRRIESARRRRELNKDKPANTPEEKAALEAQASEDSYIDDRAALFDKEGGKYKIKRDLRKIEVIERDFINQGGDRFKRVNEAFPNADKAWHILHERLLALEPQNDGKDYDRVLKLMGAKNAFTAATEAILVFAESKLLNGDAKAQMEVLTNEIFGTHRLGKTALKQLEQIWAQGAKSNVVPLRKAA